MSQENQIQTPKIFVIHNPVAGTSNPDVVRTEIESRLTSHKRKHQIYETTGEESVRKVVEDALQKGYQTIWAAGGDGTVSAVANGLVTKDIPMGIIPIGTVNSLARELDIPLDLTVACDLLLGAHKTRVLDVLKVDKDYFLLSVSAGISALMIAETARQQKRRLGQLAYLLNGARILLSKYLWPFRLTVDGQPLLIRASEVIATNVGSVGYKSIQWGNQVRPDDGKVDLCRARVDSFLSLFSLAGGLLLDRQDRLEELNCNPAYDFIEIRSRRRIPVQGDGEDIGHTPVRIEIIKHSLPVVVPPGEE
jgi:YegS/Rv2252/BmrU family lipid kinase